MSLIAFLLLLVIDFFFGWIPVVGTANLPSLLAWFVAQQATAYHFWAALIPSEARADVASVITFAVWFVPVCFLIRIARSRNSI